jgi:hypothetical protein
LPKKRRRATPGTEKFDKPAQWTPYIYIYHLYIYTLQYIDWSVWVYIEFAELHKIIFF